MLRFANGRRNSVGTIDHALAIRHVVDLMDKDRALFCQLIHNIAVMDDFAADIDGRAEGLKSDFDDVDRADHAGAEAARLEQQHPLLVGDAARLATVESGVEDRGSHSNSIPMLELIGVFHRFKSIRDGDRWTNALKREAAGACRRLLWQEWGQRIISLDNVLVT